MSGFRTLAVTTFTDWSFHKWFVPQRSEYYQLRTNEIDQYEFMATLEFHTYSICGWIDVQVFAMKESYLDVNYPTIHHGVGVLRCIELRVYSMLRNDGYAILKLARADSLLTMKFEKWLKRVYFDTISRGIKGGLNITEISRHVVKRAVLWEVIAQKLTVAVNSRCR